MTIKIIKGGKTAPTKDPAPYAVGYGKPPKSAQFKPGQSGNPKGRPKGVPSLSEIAATEAARLVKVQTGGKVHHLSKLQALVRKLFEMALHGNLKAAQMGFAILQQKEAAGDLVQAIEAPLSETELAVLKDAALLSKTGGAS